MNSFEKDIQIYYSTCFEPNYLSIYIYIYIYIYILLEKINIENMKI